MKKVFVAFLTLLLALSVFSGCRLMPGQEATSSSDNISGEYLTSSSDENVTSSSDENVTSSSDESETIEKEYSPDDISSEYIIINEKNFPDPLFREYVADEFDTDNDGALSQDERKAVKEILIEGPSFDAPKEQKISDLSGIVFFLRTDIY